MGDLVCYSPVLGLLSGGKWGLLGWFEAWVFCSGLGCFNGPVQMWH